MSELTIEQAVDLLYRGRSNVPNAAAAAEVSPQELKKALEEKVSRTPPERVDESTTEQVGILGLPEEKPRHGLDHAGLLQTARPAA